MKVWVREWRTRPDKATQLFLDVLGVEGASRLEHGELGDLYIADLDQLLTRGMVFVCLPSHPTYILYPMGDGQAYPDTVQFLEDMAQLDATRVLG